MRIVLTRNPTQAGALEDGLRKAGLQVDFLPLTQQHLPADLSELETTVQRLERGDFAWLLLTSGNTVRALLSCGWSGSAPDQTRIGVVGPGTARVLKERTALRPSWMPHDHSAAGILAELPTPASGTPLMLPQSAQARSQLASGLRAQGWSVTRVTAYETVQSDSSAFEFLERKLNADDAVLVTSSSAAEVWATLQVPKVTVLAIGRPTADTLRQLGHPADAVLSEPTAAGALKSLADLDA